MHQKIKDQNKLKLANKEFIKLVEKRILVSHKKLDLKKINQ